MNKNFGFYKFVYLYLLQFENIFKIYQYNGIWSEKCQGIFILYIA